MNLLGVDVVIGEDEAVVAGDEVARDRVVVCRRVLPRSMCVVCFGQSSAWLKGPSMARGDE